MAFLLAGRSGGRAGLSLCRRSTGPCCKIQSTKGRSPKARSEAQRSSAEDRQVARHHQAQAGLGCRRRDQQGRGPARPAAGAHQRPGRRAVERPAPQDRRLSGRREHSLGPPDGRSHESRGADDRARVSRRSSYGYNGAGVGVAVIDSGVDAWHDDLTTGQPCGDVGQRVAEVRRLRQRPYSRRTTTSATARTSSGIIAGNGYDTSAARRGHRAGCEPRQPQGARRRGDGVISDVIAALDSRWPEQDRLQHPRHQPVGRRGDDRVVQDRPADAGRQARGRCGHRRRGGRRQPRQERRGPAGQYGGITAPGNAPWVLTVGASSHEGTPSPLATTRGGRTARAVRPGSTSRPSPTRGAGHRHRVAGSPSSLFYSTQAAYLMTGSDLARVQAVSEPDRARAWRRRSSRAPSR